MGTSRGLAKFNSLNNIINYYQQIPSLEDKLENNFGKLTEDENGFIWSSLDGRNKLGLVCFDKKSGHFRIYRSDPIDQTSLSTNDIASVYNDHSGVLWVGTRWAGLNKWDRNRHKFKRFSFEPNNPVNGKFNSVYSIIEDSEGIIWFGNDNGLNSFNRTTNKFRINKYNSADKDNSITHIYLDESGFIWFGTSTRGL